MGVLCAALGKAGAPHHGPRCGQAAFSAGPGRGLPLGNLTSQLLVNIYMNEFDHFVKRILKVEYYIRYADDFTILSPDKPYLEELLPKIGDYLTEHLRLTIHPDKVFIKNFCSGIDFLGWVHFPHHRVLRRSTKRRIFRKLEEDLNESHLQSYMGLLNHGNAHKIAQKLPTIPVAFEYEK